MMAGDDICTEPRLHQGDLTLFKEQAGCWGVLSCLLSLSLSPEMLH